VPKKGAAEGKAFGGACKSDLSRRLAQPLLIEA